MRLLLLIVSSSIFSFAFAGKADTIAVYSNSMKKDIKTVVITPKQYGKKKRTFPVVYLLHGYGGSYNNWVNRVPDLTALADKNQLIIVCPDGAFGSWYFDSPVDSSFRYETFVAKELPNYIDNKYKTIRDRKARAITGLSMGGHGGMFLGFRHAETFGACGSMSGALDVSLITRGYDMQKRLGDTITNKKYYQDWSVMKVMEQYPKDSLAIIIDCGTEDFIYGMSKAAHEKMMKLKIQHDYIERPGRHDWKYWDKAVRYQLLFFKEFFEKGRK
jgi:S-formylglutathione hydrolase FrmB